MFTMSDFFDLFGPRVFVVSDSVFQDYQKTVKNQKIKKLDEEIQYYEKRVEALKKERESLDA